MPKPKLADQRAAKRPEKLAAARELLGDVEIPDTEKDDPETVESDRCPECEVGTMRTNGAAPRSRPPPLAPPWTGPPMQEAA